MIYLITNPKAKLLLPITMRYKKIILRRVHRTGCKQKVKKGIEDCNEMKFKPVEFDGFKRILKS